MFQTYFKAIQSLYLADKESSELTYRTPLENLLNAFKDEFINRKLIVKHETIKQEDKGRPDFKITTKEQLTIGLIETKKIGEELKKHLNSKQLNNYKQLSDNIILTDYLNFYLIKKGVPVINTELFPEYSLGNKRYKLEQTRIDEITKLFTSFFESEPETIYKTQDLAMKLSEKARFLREYSRMALLDDQEEINLLIGVYEAFRKTLLPLLDKEYFADIYAQTVTYGLFLAALNCDNPLIQLENDRAYNLMPNTFPLIKELFHQIEKFPKDIVWAIDEIISILKSTDFAAIKKEFYEYRNKERGFSDPFIYFYEDFLKHYDKNQREVRGVYYTPEPVVSFIVKSVEILLNEDFNMKDGFINKDVTLLDFATGTGTFLLNAFNLAIEQASKIGDKFFVNKLLNENIIQNFYGFELLVAPYVIAHLKISEFFKELGLSILPDNRLNIYLTNTLTNNEPEPFFLMPSLSKEGKEANRIKNKDVLVILGNPPYSGHSANVDKWISSLMKAYYEVDGKKLEEKNPKWLQDDYVKFIRFAQWKLEKVDRGIVGIITNHSYLDNPTFRGMRQSLLKTFDEIYILDLHGNAKKKEKSPDGSKDENIFDIQQGVSIALFVKNGGKNGDCKVFHSDLFGSRDSKYNSLLQMDIKSTDWKAINPNTPFYLFKHRNEESAGVYNNGLSIKDIFSICSVGVVTSRDDFVIDGNITKLKERISDFRDLSIPDYEILKKYDLNENSKFKLNKSRSIIAGLSKVEFNQKFSKIHYRPFDFRYVFYDDSVIERMRKDVMINMKEENISLISVRQVSSGDFEHAFISSNIIESCVISNRTKEINYFYPLYILSNGEEKIFFGVKEPEIAYGSKTKQGLHKKANFTDQFRDYIFTKYKNNYTPEQIMGYIYAVLHSPVYRTKYIEFLKIDFPRIPFTDDEDVFRELSGIGFKLIEHHLLKETYITNICKLKGSGQNFLVEKVEYEVLKPGENHDADLIFKVTGGKSGRVWFNKERCFEPVPEPIWNFHIGGYQVLEKWLKERKKHEISLSGEDVQHFIKVVNVLDQTIKTMKQIDELTKEWI